MGRRSVDNATLGRWRSLDAFLVLQKLGCYAKVDETFVPLTAQGTLRYHVNAVGRDFEFLLRGPKFFDPRLRRGGGGALNLVIHLHDLDFKRAADVLRRLAV